METGATKQRYSLVDMNSIKDVKKEDIFSRSDDGKTIITTDGLKVSDELIAQAKAEAKAQAAAVGAASKAGVDLDDPQFVDKVTAIAMSAAQKVLNEFRVEMEKGKK